MEVFMGSAGIIGKRALLKKGDLVPPIPATIFTTIAEVYELSEFDYSREPKDATYHTGGYASAQILGIVPPINLSYLCNYVSEQFLDFWTLVRAEQDLSWWQVLLPNDYYYLFEGYVSGLKMVTPLDDRITYELKIAVTQDVGFSNIPLPVP
jgi:hypothetical protein